MRIEVLLAVAFALLAIATIMDPQWIEQLFAFEPDSGGGDAEWLVTTAFGMASLVASVFARRDWKLLAAESAQ
jgi:hypothetical protein